MDDGTESIARDTTCFVTLTEVENLAHVSTIVLHTPARRARIVEDCEENVSLRLLTSPYVYDLLGRGLMGQLEFGPL